MNFKQFNEVFVEKKTRESFKGFQSQFEVELHHIYIANCVGQDQGFIR